SGRADRRDLPAGRRPRGVYAPRAGAHKGKDRPPALAPPLPLCGRVGVGGRAALSDLAFSGPRAGEAWRDPPPKLPHKATAFTHLKLPGLHPSLRGSELGRVIKRGFAP